MTKANALHALLKRIARIARMERGALCRMTGRPHYNHQTWRNGRNVSCYVPPGEVRALQEAIDGYRRFLALTQQYADVIIQRTRAARARAACARKPLTHPATRCPGKRLRQSPPKDV
jgi:hypothetical protein